MTKENKPEAHCSEWQKRKPRYEMFCKTLYEDYRKGLLIPAGYLYYLIQHEQVYPGNSIKKLGQKVGSSRSRFYRAMKVLHQQGAIDASRWIDLDRSALEQPFYPEHRKQIHLFGEANPLKLTAIRSTCAGLGVVVPVEAEP
ncbi:helix-turn-helix domain-containing protein [Leptolyngbya sp. GB1-A1]|uniref:helix-turn-helix domain-containing protein n=1 Tax=Leptolyngbya sp. GB1-A1 TaxID=2933908 RepID=UPI0032990B28